MEENFIIPFFLINSEKLEVDAFGNCILNQYVHYHVHLIWVCESESFRKVENTWEQPLLTYTISSLFKYKNCHCTKSFRIWSYSGPHFPAFRLSTERNRVSLRIQSECGKMRTRITLNTDTFHGVCKKRMLKVY